MLRDGVIPAGPKRMASSDAANGEPAPTRGAVLLERLDCIRGATRIITTGGRQERPQGDLIPSNEQYQQRAHAGVVGSLFAWHFRGRRSSKQPGTYDLHLGPQLRDVGGICLVSRPNDHVRRGA